MTVAFDNVSPDTSSAAGVTSLTSSAWTIAGANRVAIGIVATGDVTGSNPTGMKWRGSGGNALTQIGTTLGLGTHGKLSAWRLIAPTAESNTSHGTWGASQGEAIIAMVSYTGVDQTTPIGTPVTATGGTNGVGSATATCNVPTAVGDLVFAAAFVHNTASATNPTVTPAGGSTGRYDVEGATVGGFAALQCIELVATGTTTVMSVDIASADINLATAWAITAFVVKAAGGGDGSATLTGVAGTGAAGTLTVSVAANVTLTGVQAAGNVGSLAENVSTSVVLDSVQASGAVGTITASSTGDGSVTLAALAAAGELGILTLSSEPAVSLSAVAAAGAVAGLGVESSPALQLAPIVGAGQVGDLSAASSAGVTLDGIQAQGHAGQIDASGGTTLDASVNLAAVSASAAVGILDASSSAGVALASIAATGMIGALSAASSADIDLQAIVAASALGPLAAASNAVSVTLDGVAAVGSVGDLTVGEAVPAAAAPISDGVISAIAAHIARAREAARRIDAEVQLDGIVAQGSSGALLAFAKTTAVQTLVQTLPSVSLPGLVRLAPRVDASVELPGLACMLVPLPRLHPVPTALLPDDELEEFAILAAVGWR